MTILITGAGGTVSRAVLRALEGTADVRVLVRDPAKAPAGSRSRSATWTSPPRSTRRSGA
ncbi:hypothetical protein ACFQ0B_11690 [Nonomuraea thailandensis]